MDETRAPVLDPGRKRTKTGYLWAITRDDRPWGGGGPPAVAYFYAPDRGAEHAIGPLAGFSGVLQVDGYAAYQALGRSRARRWPGDAGLLLVYEIAQGGNGHGSRRGRTDGRHSERC
jgi:transposase